MGKKHPDFTEAETSVNKNLLLSWAWPRKAHTTVALLQDSSCASAPTIRRAFTVMAPQRCVNIGVNSGFRESIRFLALPFSGVLSFFFCQGNQ